MSSKFEVCTVRRARLDDLPYIDHVTRAENYRTAALGFIPTVVYEGVITGQGSAPRPTSRLWIAEVNHDQVGFLYLTPGLLGASAKIVQVAVQEDARRNEYATALAAEAESYAAGLFRPGISCAVATDLEAGKFWDALGYELRRIEQGGRRRDRQLERRVKQIAVPGLW